MGKASRQARALGRAAEARRGVDQDKRALGIRQTRDGDTVLPRELMQQVYEERARLAAESHVPSTPRIVNREGGGVGVRKGSALPTVAWETLRRIREQSPLISVVQNARLKQVQRLSVAWPGKLGEVGWRVVHKDHHSPTAQPPEGFTRYIDEFTSIMERPAPQHGITSTSQLLLGLVDDFLTLNRPCLEVLNLGSDRSRVVGFKPVDGALIWPSLYYMERWLTENPSWYGHYNPSLLSDNDAMDIASKKMGVDLRACEYVLVRDGILEGTYDAKRIICAPQMNRTDIRLAGYWPSTVECAMEAALSGINVMVYETSQFTTGMMTDFALLATGVHPDELTRFRDSLREATQGAHRAHAPPVLDAREGTLSRVELKNQTGDMRFANLITYLASLVCAHYRTDPSTINLKSFDGGGGNKLGSDGGRGKEIDLAKEEGLQGDLQHIKESMLDPLAMRCHPDLRVLFEYGDFDPQKHAQVMEVRSRTSITRNEVRLEDGLDPLGFWVPRGEYKDLSDEDKDKYDGNLWNMPSDAGFAQMLSGQIQAAQQAAQQAAMPPPDDGFGQPQDPNQQDDGFGGQPPRMPFGGQPPEAPGGSPPALPPAIPGAPGPRQPPGGAAPMAKAVRKVTRYVEVVSV